ncbi:LD-carboxypeptidase [Pontibacter diazotrophicus]|uniref:LD-carboxypeptidase n=1 Tax=Pontibacter diazotrophicus TaxID=1400979 RepID=A0A3D8LDI0_9BACT|nr:S66 peptidase family protein [Pontibacter diazotrophicus]RDV15356.1 LD-carboxypeptidase [Pontibacter diazotrophicus]
MIPPKLKSGDHVRVIAPAHGLSPKLTKENKEQAIKGFGELGLTVSYGKYVHERDEFNTTPIEKRLEDLHDAFTDPNVQAIIPAMGGSSANQLLKYIDYELIRENPKILCGLSDITALANAIYAKTKLVTYYGPHFTMLGASKIVDYSFEYMKKTFFSDAAVRINPSEYYIDSEWDSQVIVNEGFWSINEGEVKGKSIGGNFITLNLLMGSEFMPDLTDSIVFLEANKVIEFRDVQNYLQAILNQPDSHKIKGLIIGRFQKDTSMTRELLTTMIHSKKELKNVPVAANVDFGHTAPMCTLPVGGNISLQVKKDDKVHIIVEEH